MLKGLSANKRIAVPAVRACISGALRVGVVGLCSLVAFSGRAKAQSPVDQAWTVLRGGLSDKTISDRASAARLLGLLENNATAQELAVKALADPKPEVRGAAVDALGQMRAKSAVPKLVELVKSEQEVSVIMACGRSLIKLGDPIGYNVYYAILTGERKSGAGLLDEQKKMLGDPKKMAQFGFEQGIGFVPFGGVGYGAFKAVTKDDSSPVRAAAAAILAKDADPKSGAALVAAASDKSWIVRAASLDAISHRGDPALLPQIAPKLTDDKEIVRYTAAAAIIHLADIQAAK